jgi:hypothetical protein
MSGQSTGSTETRKVLNVVYGCFINCYGMQLFFSYTNTYINIYYFLVIKGICCNWITVLFANFLH